MHNPGVRDAYSIRADEYVNVLGAVEDMHDADRKLIERWSTHLPSGVVLDAGCGPGHLTAFLYERGLQVAGVDLVPEFIDSARTRFPEVPFHLGSFAHLDLADRSVSGVLAWYSLIHSHPKDLPLLLDEFSRVLVPGGGLLIGFFDGAAAELFPHAITTAYYWSIKEMSAMLDQTGFDIAEIHQRQDPGTRPHAAITAVAR